MIMGLSSLMLHRANTQQKGPDSNPGFTAKPNSWLPSSQGKNETSALESTFSLGPIQRECLREEISHFRGKFRGQLCHFPAHSQNGSWPEGNFLLTWDFVQETLIQCDHVPKERVT